MTRRNLVVVRAGDVSLHPQWLTSKERNWDLVVIYAGNHPERYLDQYDHLHRHSGPKWVAIADFLANRGDLVQRYEYVWFPDDDLLTTGRNINDFFDICRELRLTLGQPALTEYGHHVWEITLREPALLARMTDFVEIAAPCFSVARLGVFSSAFAENTSGYGYEFVWSRLARNAGVLRFGIVDRTPVCRTRPPGRLDGVVADPAEEESRVLRKYGVERFSPAVLKRIPWEGYS